jgi:site-specific recombinase XerC
VEALLAGVTKQRDKAILMLFISSGLRLAELVSLDKNSIRVETVRRGQRVQILGIGTVVGKGSKEREFYVDLPTLKQLRQYEIERGQDDVPALFTSNRKKRMTPRSIQHMLHKWCRKLNLPAIHPHALRHTAGSTWHRLGMGTLEISNLLGHASVATTQLYIRPDDARLRAEYFAAMEKISPRAELPKDGGEMSLPRSHS